MKVPHLTTLYDALLGSESQKALIVGSKGPQYTRGQLQASIIDFALRLKHAGIQPGDVVSIAMTNTADFVVAFLGVTYARAIAAPLNAAYRQDEFKFYMEDAKSKVLILPSEGNKAASQPCAQLKIPIVTLALDLTPRGQARVLLSSDSPQFKIKPTPLESSSPDALSEPDPSDVALFLHTSGTTSRPKGVPLTHANLVASLANIIATYQLTPADRSYLVMPLFHVHGLMAGLLAPLAAGAAVILPAEGKFAAHAFWRDCCEHGATYYTAVPTIHQVLLARAAHDYPAASPPPLRFIRSCSASLAPAILEKLEATFKVPVLEAYAMTEAAHQMTSNPLPSVGPHKAGTVGTAQGGVQVAILDDQNQLLGTGKIGEICIRGSNITPGYLNNPAANKEAFAGGWFHTGDQGWLDPEGYLTLTGRLKELINRGGEKISPLEVDAALLSHPAVAEAVSFGAPDEKYGEVVCAAVVLKTGVDPQKEGIAADIKEHCAQKLAAFKVPIKVFITDALPKTATGKIQRRHMVGHFITPPAAASAPPAPAGSSHASTPSTEVAGLNDGYEVVCEALARMGVKYMFGVVGIPVTPLASSAQAAGIRFIGFRNEQAAGYAAATVGFLTGHPAALLTVSGPGAVHGLAGLSHATTNRWPLVMISGSAVQAELGKGSFQECDQVAVSAPFCRYVGRASQLESIPDVIRAAVTASITGAPGGTYVDLPADVLLARIPVGKTVRELVERIPEGAGLRPHPTAAPASIAHATQLLKSAARPLVVVGKGAAIARAEKKLQALVNGAGLPVLSTSMGRGLLPDSHPLVVNAARSAAIKDADVVLVLGARLNWQLHFGEAPRWAPDVKFILVDVEPSSRDAGLAAVVLRGDADAVLGQLTAELQKTSGLDPSKYRDWVAQLTKKAASAAASLEKRLAAPPKTPLMDYYTAIGVVRQQLALIEPAPVVVSEGANTMDMARLLLPVSRPRTRVDAGTWGTMGGGLGAAIAAALVEEGKLVVALEGDSAFGFSGMELETIVRYQLPVVVLIINNGGIYGGDRREQPLAIAAQSGASKSGFGKDPPPTSFVEQTRYDLLMSAFGGASYRVSSPEELKSALSTAFTALRPALVDIVIDPMAGVESGNVHAFNAPKSKL